MTALWHGAQRIDLVGNGGIFLRLLYNSRGTTVTHEAIKAALYRDQRVDMSTVYSARDAAVKLVTTAANLDGVRCQQPIERRRGLGYALTCTHLRAEPSGDAVTVRTATSDVLSRLGCDAVFADRREAEHEIQAFVRDHLSGQSGPISMVGITLRDYLHLNRGYWFGDAYASEYLARGLASELYAGLTALVLDPDSSDGVYRAAFGQHRLDAELTDQAFETLCIDSPRWKEFARLGYLRAQPSVHMLITEHRAFEQRYPAYGPDPEVGTFHGTLLPVFAYRAGTLGYARLTEEFARLVAGVTRWFEPRHPLSSDSR